MTRKRRRIPQPYRPETLAEALQFLHEHGGGLAMHERGLGVSGITPSGKWMDTSRLHELAGVHMFQRRLIIGLNMRYAELQFASLVRQHALCLVEVCEANAHADNTLMADFWRHPWPDTIAALATLDAEVEIARLRPSSSIQRMWLPWEAAFLTLSVQPQLPLAVRIQIRPGAVGSAYVPLAEISGALTSPVEAAIAHLVMQPPRITTIHLGIMPIDHIPLRLPEAESVLKNQTPTPPLLNRCAEVGQNELHHYLQQRQPPPQYTINPTAHLLRVALDRAVARAHAARS